nr:hypothetical protein [Tanacetum cinerariifolium]
ASLKKRVKKLEQKRKSRTLRLKRLRKGRMNEEDIFGVNDLDGDEVVIDVLASKKVEQSVKVIEKEVTTAGIEVTTAATTLQISKDELTLAQTLIEIKATKPKGIIHAATTVTAWIEAFVPIDTKLVKGSEKVEKGNKKIAGGSEKAQEDSSKRAADNLE